MLNTQVSASPTPTASNVDAGSTEGTMGRMANFNAGVDGNKSTLKPPKATKADITSDIK